MAVRRMPLLASVIAVTLVACRDARCTVEGRWVGGIDEDGEFEESDYPDRFATCAAARPDEGPPDVPAIG